jgi:hypothetical protein
MMEGFRPGRIILDEFHYWERTGRLYMGTPGDTDPPRYVEPGLANVYRCTCGCAEITHQLPGGHCLMPCCKDEPCTVKKPDPWLGMVADITGLRDPESWH